MVPRVRGLMHVHSTISDGAFTPAQLRELAQGQGYQFIVLCEHTQHFPFEERPVAAQECRRISDDGFLCLFALECNAEGRHVLLLGPEEYLFEARDSEVGLTPGKAREAGGLTIWAHPGATTYPHLRRAIAADYDGWEVWNQYTDGPLPSFPVLSALLRQRRQGRRLLALGGADYHDPARHSLYPALEVDLPTLEGPALIESLRAERYHIVRDARSAPLISPEGKCERPSPWEAAYSAVRYGGLRLRSLYVYQRRRRAYLRRQRAAAAKNA